MADDTPLESFRYRIRREASGIAQWWRDNWRTSKWFRRIAVATAAMLVVLLGAWTALTYDLPSTNKLLTYQPPMPTMVRGNDGDIVYSYARDRRVQLRFVDFPKPLIDAFLSAEDRTFWTHGGVDLGGLAGAVIDYVRKFGTGERAKGGSTITQQVAKDILIGNQYSITRKLKEMILARRIEHVLTKQQILEIYLNEIPLGRHAFGVQAAARAYFNKDVDQLDLHQAAFLAILPKAPEIYGRARFAAKALARRNWVLDQMVRNGWVTREAAEAAKAKPLGLVAQHNDEYKTDAGYFLEEVRRELIDKYGETAADGPHSVYAGGLWVRTSLDTQLQDAARDALRAGLMRYGGDRGWHGPIARLKMDGGKWRRELASTNLGIEYRDWRIGVVLDVSGSTGKIGFTDGNTYALTGIPRGPRPGDIVAAAPSGSGYALKIVPEVSGGMIVEDPQNGRILAMQGGFDSRLGAFNRATQAERQPGSTIKPFVYATALDYGMTPATQVVDGTFCVYQGAALGQKCFRNFANEGGSGTHTMRWGLEQSRNLMTVRIANDTGMDHVVNTIKRLGIGNYQPYLSMALGAGDTTVERMVNAYAALADHGRQHPATVIDYVQDRNGKVIWRADTRRCDGCNMPEWDGKPMPRFRDDGKQVLDPRIAYQVVHMLRGVIVRGTGVVLRDINLPLIGKTGTTSGPTNVWFVGGTPEMLAGVYVGYDHPRSLGGWAQGGRIAGPIVKQFIQSTIKRWSDIPFAAPAGIRMERIDRVTGRPVFAGTPDNNDPKAPVIWEAFKPNSEPKRAIGLAEMTAKEQILDALRKAMAQRDAAAAQNSAARNFAADQGGIY